ncbi:RNA-binding domain-containing protein [Artomyces pyxidatus]|uniref:RNA-binding domain-containing protein n=1 Tax=Artomyces pyxidatus TaxID=48021 RepID=A0ACB8SIG9_9AGAM|nr:RNA-binding domain-containing protein [Artomyces pyxidatus]
MASLALVGPFFLSLRPALSYSTSRQVKQEQNASRPASVPANAASPTPQARHPPTSDEIDAVIQMATSSRASPDGRPIPLKDTRTQLFAGNLPYRVRWQDLKDLFRKAGTVLRADVSLGPDNRSRGYGTVLLATAEDAGRAVDMFNGYSWQSRILEVRLDRLPQDLDNPPGSAPGYLSPVPPPPIRTMPYSMSPLPPSSILGQMPQIGPPLSLDDPYADYTMFGHDRPGTAGSVSRNLFVGNLPFHCQWQDLKDLFRQAGTILRADVALGQDGRSRGFGTVVFATELDAERAVKMFNG